MDRRTGITLGASLAFACGMALGACSQQDAAQTASTAGAETQTTQVTLPVVTVYKAPT